MSEIKLDRTGGRPLVFTGELVGEQAGEWHRGKQRNRFFNLFIYHTAAGKYVAARVYKTFWSGEAGRAEAEVFGDLDEAAAWFVGFDPSEIKGIGFPPKPQFEKPQEYLMGTLRQIYQDRVATLLGEIGAVERVA
jgi:hypothetical protein